MTQRLYAYTSDDRTKLDGIETGAEANNISDVNATDLTDSGESTLHYHDSDRTRANHTGTQDHTTISDYDTELAGTSNTTAFTPTTDYHPATKKYVDDNVGGVSSNEASATASTTTTSTSDVLINSMTLTPGAGTYLVFFSASWKNGNNDTNYVSIYANGAQLAESERRFYTEDSIPNTPVPVATQGTVTGLGAAQDIEIKWRVSGDTATMYERTLTILKIG